MASFRVGQRVRVIATDPGSDGELHRAVGREAVVTSIPPKCGPIQSRYGWYADCEIIVDGIGAPWLAGFHQLAPLTDPNASRFIESMERFAKQPVDIQKFAQRDVGAFK